MIYKLTRLALGVLSLIVALFFVVGIILTAPGAAQELPGNETEQSQPEATDVHKTLGDLTIHSVDFEDDPGGVTGYVEVTWHGDTPEQVTITQMPTGGLFGSADDAVTISRNRVYPGERTELAVDLVSQDDPAAIYTTQSLANERALRIEDDGGFLIDGPWDSTDSQITGIAGLLAGFSTVTLFAYRRTNQGDEIEREL